MPQNGAAPGKNRNGRKEALLWMCGYGKKHIGAIVLYTFLGLAGTLGGLLGSLVSKNLVDIITGHDTGELVKTFALMIGTALATMLIGQVSAYVSSLISVRVANDVKADIFDVIMRTEWEFLSDDSEKIPFTIINLSDFPIIQSEEQPVEQFSVQRL